MELTKNAAVAAPVATIILLLSVIGIGHSLTTDWPTIWFAVTGLGAFLSLAALFAAALYARAQLAQARFSAEAQIGEAQRAARESHFFEQVKLTRDFLHANTSLAERLGGLIRDCQGLTPARRMQHAAITKSDPEAIKLRYDTTLALGEAAELYAEGVLAREMFLRRADYWICAAWYFYGKSMREWDAVGALPRMTDIRQIVLESYRSIRAVRPQRLDVAPELRNLDIE